MEIDAKPTTSADTFESALVLYKSLSIGPFSRLASRFEKEINSCGIVPKRIDLFGNEIPQTLREFLQHRSLSNVPSVQNLLKCNKETLQSRRMLNPSRKKTSNHILLLETRQNGNRVDSDRCHAANLIEQALSYQYQITGHIEKTYNVMFDRTGRYILTGSDDALIKLWELDDALLRYSFRGNNGIVVDMDISYCNQLLASVGGDKCIRIFDLQKGSQVDVAKFHTNAVVCINFLRKVHGNKRWLVSFGNDCNVIFYEFDEETKIFNEKSSMIFNVRTASGMKVISGTHSACGNWVAAGDSHGNVHLFRFDENNFKMDMDFKAISEKLDTLEWSNSSTAFIACSSRHHAGRIWRYINSIWCYLEFSPQMDETVLGILHSTKLKYGICTAIWSLDDSYIIASGTDFRIRVYDAFTGKQKHCFDGHKAEVYHLKCHPILANILVTSAHDGFIFIWDIEKGKILKKFANNTRDGDGDLISSAILDCAFSNDGTALSTVDDLGRLTVYSYYSNDGHKAPKEQFFSSDYELLEFDETNFSLDANTGLAPHLNTPPWLVDLNQVVLDEKWQKRVPGREKEDDTLTCPWLTRSVVPVLHPSARERWAEKQRAIAAEPELEFTDGNNPFEKLYTPLGADVIPVKVTQSRKKREIPTVDEVARMQEERHLQDNLFGYRSEDDADYNGSSGEENNRDEITDSDSSDESYSDHANGPSRVDEQQQEPITTSSGRRVRSTQNSQQVYSSPTRRSRRSRRNAENGEREELNTEDEDTRDAPLEDQDQMETEDGMPGPSEDRKPKEKRERKKKNKEVDNEALATFPLSMQKVKPERFPYVAQLGDRIVYCKLGHINYLDRVQQLGLYPVSSKMRPRAELKTEEFCIVDEIKYSRKPYRLTNLRLAQVNKHGELSGVTFNVKYHDLQDCPDFLILRQHYDQVTTNPLHEGHEMEAVIDGSWWTGTVLKRQATNPDYPTSPWNCLSILWDNGDNETMSPWDCQPKTTGRKSGTPATSEDIIQMGDYFPTDEDWPGNERPERNMEKNCDRLYQAVNSLSVLETILPFSFPVNLAEFPSYALSVDYCIDLQTIAERLSNRFYRSLKAVQHDIRHIAVAAEQFNEPSSVIVSNSRRLVEALLRFSKDTFMDAVDIVGLFDSLFDLPDDEIVEYRQRETILFQEDILHLASSNQHEEPKEPGWIGEVRGILSSLFQHRCAKPFLDKNDTDDHSISVGLAEYGDLKTVLAELHHFSGPQGVVKRIGDIMDACREALEDPRSRIFHNTHQLMSLVEQKMKSQIDEFNRISNNHLIRRLRKRKRTSQVYQTRSSAREQPGPSTSYRTLTRNASSSRLSTREISPLEERPTRPLRRNTSAVRIEEREEEVLPVRSTRRRPTLTSTSSDPPSSPRRAQLDADSEEEEEEEFGGSLSPPPPPQRRRAQRVREELNEELRELIEDEEERMDSRRPTRSRKRKASTDSEDEDFSEDSRSTRSSRPLRSTRRSTRRRGGGSDDEEKINISSYGRIRRTRQLD